MNTILNLKRGDLCLQALAFFVPILLSCIKEDGSCFFSYLTVGIVQAISVIANLFLNARLKHRDRKYAIWILSAIITGIALPATLNWYGLMLYFLFSLLFISPFIAVWYACITYEELLIVKRYANRKRYVMTN